MDVVDRELTGPLLDIMPRAANALLRTIYSSSDKGLVERCLKALVAQETAIIEFEPNAEAYNYRGVALFELGRYEEAGRDFTMATELNPGMADAYSNRGASLSELREYEEAVRDFTRTLNLKQAEEADYMATYNNRGFALTQMGLYEEALEDLIKVLGFIPEKIPEIVAVHKNLGLAYEGLGELEKAKGAYQIAIDSAKGFKDRTPHFERLVQEALEGMERITTA